MKMKYRFTWWDINIILPAAIYFGVFFLYPVVKILLTSLFSPQFTLEYYKHIFTRGLYLSVIWNSVEIAFWVTLVTLMVGFPIAYLIVHAPPKFERYLLLLIVSSLWLSVLVRTYAWMVLLQNEGVINKLLLSLGIIGSPLPLIYNRLGVFIGMLHVQLPFMVLPLYAIMKRIDPSLRAVADSMGSTPGYYFVKIFLPQVKAGIIAGILLVFILSIGFFITPALLGGGRGDTMMIAMLIEEQINTLAHWEFGTALSAILLIFIGVFLFIFNKLVHLDQILGEFS